MTKKKDYTKGLSVMLIISVFLSVLLIASPISALSNYIIIGNHNPSIDGLDYTESILNKYISPVEGEKDLFDVTLDITGKNRLDVPPTDIIILLDESSSMKGEKFEKALSATQKFSDELLTLSENISLGIIGFSGDVRDTLTFTKTKDDIAAFLQQQSAATNSATFLQKALREGQSMLDARPEEHQKIIIVLSDGGPTYSYKATELAANNGEIKDFNGQTSDYIVSKSSDTRVGLGSYFGLLSQAYTVENKIVDNNIIPTVSEILDFKKQPNHKVYVLSIDLMSESGSTDGTYQGKAIQGAQASWDETVKDGVLSPGEIFTMTLTYKNESSSSEDVIAGVEIPNTFPFPSMDEYIEEYTNGGITSVVTATNGARKEYTYSQTQSLYSRVKNQGLNSANDVITLAPGESYTYTATFTIKDDFEWLVDGKEIPNSNQMSRLGFFKFQKTGMPAYQDVLVYNPAQSLYPMFGVGVRFGTTDMAEYVLKNISSDGIQGNTYFKVDSANDLSNVMSTDLLSVMTDYISNGQVIDPMGPEYIQFLPDSFDGNSFKLEGKKNGVVDDTLISDLALYFDEASQTIKVDNINLGADETITITYRIKLLSENEGFTFGAEYLTNGNAILIPYEGAEDRVFPSPSVGIKEIIINDPTIETTTEPESEGTTIPSTDATTPSTTSPSTTSPSTGDTINRTLLSLLTVTSLGITAVLIHKRKKEAELS